MIRGTPYPVLGGGSHWEWDPGGNPSPGVGGEGFLGGVIWGEVITITPLQKGLGGGKGNTRAVSRWVKKGTYIYNLTSRGEKYSKNAQN